ncbi:tRNA pseudouridine(38-40) synthase TruA [Thermostilla marina]
MRTIRLLLAYDGTAYAGWQIQPNHPTIQGAVSDAIRRVSGEDVRPLASGRTDAGVHALGQVAVFRTESSLSAEVWSRALNANLPPDIRVRHADEVSPDFHPIRDAAAKRYRYLIQDGRPLPVWRNMAWQIPYKIDQAAAQEAAEQLRGRHDFSAFETSGAPRKSSVRTVTALSVNRVSGGVLSTGSDELLAIEIEADGFLYNMVRNIVGSLVEVGRKARPPEWIGEVLESRDRRIAGPTAPPQGLFLVRVTYPPPYEFDL